MIRHLTFDARDPYAVAAFWAGALGGAITAEDSPGDDSVLVEHGGTPPLLFERVPEAKAVKNRVHLDLQPEGPQAEEVDRLQALGATVVDDRRTPEGGWVVMADPEGHVFCVEPSAAARA
ncbi:MAG: VOC family protein [Actinobacteria bacterium]|uniref:Unannotated protein n=1 Tax=freshwater metagenome TaxID=449393 RepID=A0A6J7ICA5_9ZZZZ|nr:VOC family protein [Actinomycetota bacterium]